MSDTPSAPEPPPLTDTDRAFLRAIADIPEDRTTWLVYADWLDDRGDPRAEFLRLVVARDQMVAGDPATAATDGRLAELRIVLDPRWMAAFDPARVARCASVRTGGCGRVWTELAPTDAPDIRVCQECRGPVYYAHTAEEAELLASCGQSVALSTRVPPDENLFPPPPPDSDEIEIDVSEIDAYWPTAVPVPVIAPAAPSPTARPWWKFW